MATVKLNVQSLAALGMSRADVEMIKFILERAISVDGAESANVPLAIVQRDLNGDFSAGTITAALTGTASNASALGGVEAALYATDADVAAAYAPLTGAGASGSWAIDIAGNAATATNAAQLGGVVAASYATQAYVNGRTKSDIGLGNVDNTSDLNKPVSTATQTALNLKANASTTQVLVAQGVTAAMVAGTISVAVASIAAGSLVIYSRKTTGGTLGHISMTQTAGVGFTLNSTSATETSTFVYQIVAP